MWVMFSRPAGLYINDVQAAEFAVFFIKVGYLQSFQLQKTRAFNKVSV